MRNLHIFLVALYSLVNIQDTLAQSTIIETSKNHSVHSFELVANLILVEGQVNEEIGWFILDTGMPDLILNQKYFSKGYSKEQFVSLSGRTTNVSKKIATFSSGILKCKNKEVIALDIPQLEIKTKRKILGLIGHRLLKNKLVIIDYDLSQISFYKTYRNGTPKFPTQLATPEEIIPFRWKGHIPYVCLKWQKERLNFGIDTGASINLIDHKHADKLNPIRRSSIKLVNIGNNKSRIKYSSIQELTAGQKSFPTMKMAAYDLTPLNQHLPGKKMDGILGHHFLHQHKVAINYRNKSISLWDTIPEKEKLLVKMEHKVLILKDR